MLRVTNETRERVLRISRDDFGGVSADETIRRLIDEHWQAAAVAAVRRYRDSDPAGWSAYLAEAEEASDVDAAVSDEWSADSD